MSLPGKKELIARFEKPAFLTFLLALGLVLAGCDGVDVKSSGTRGGAGSAPTPTLDSRAAVGQQVIDKANAHLENGTPTPSPEWVGTSDIIREATVRIQGGSLGAENAFYVNSVFSGALLSGELVGRQDILFIVTSRHTVTADLKSLRSTHFVVSVPKDGLHYVVFPEESQVVWDDELDVGVIAVKIGQGTLLGPNTGFERRALRKVQPDWHGDGQIMRAGFPGLYAATVAQEDEEFAKQPVIETLDPLHVEQEDGDYQYTTVGGSAESGGPALNNGSGLVGVHDGSHPDGYSAIAPIRNIYSLLQAVVAKLDALTASQ